MAAGNGSEENDGDLVGRVLAGRYRVVEVVTRGANTIICAATDIQSEQPVTFKIVQPDRSESEEFRRGFRKRAEFATAVGHPNIAAVLDWGDVDIDGESTVFWVVEHLGGGSLRDLFDRGRLLAPSQALVVGVEACRALDAAHQRGVAHTEITPSKLLFGADRRLRIVDFGMAELIGRSAWTEPATVATHVARYASPEQALGFEVGPKSDVYALALCLLEAVTGKVPFAAESTVATLSARVDKLMPVSADLGSLASVIERAGRPEAEDRFTAAEFGRALVHSAESLPRPEPIPVVASTLFGSDAARGTPGGGGGGAATGAAAAGAAVAPGAAKAGGAVAAAGAAGSVQASAPEGAPVRAPAPESAPPPPPAPPPAPSAASPADSGTARSAGPPAEAVMSGSDAVAPVAGSVALATATPASALVSPVPAPQAASGFASSAESGSAPVVGVAAAAAVVAGAVATDKIASALSDTPISDDSSFEATEADGAEDELIDVASDDVASDDDDAPDDAASDAAADDDDAAASAASDDAASVGAVAAVPAEVVTDAHADGDTETDAQADADTDGGAPAGVIAAAGGAGAVLGESINDADESADARGIVSADAVTDDEAHDAAADEEDLEGVVADEVVAGGLLVAELPADSTIDHPIPEYHGDGLVIVPDADDVSDTGAADATGVTHTTEMGAPIAATPATEQMPAMAVAPPSPGEPYDDDRPERRQGTMIMLGILCLAGIVAVAFAAFYLLRTKSYEVPELAGSEEAVALNEIAGNDWMVSIVRERSDDEPDAGDVIGSFPMAGAVLEEGAEFTLFVSEGPLFRVLPDVAGQTSDKAAATLADLQLQSFVDAQEFDEDVEAGVVLTWIVLGAESSVAGDEVLPGTNIALVLSKGPAPRAVPDVSGLAFEDAEATAESIQLSVTVEDEVFNDDVPSGAVISQDIAAGVELPRGGTFTVIVSKGPDLITLPDLEGLSFVAAQKALTDAGFTIGSLLGTTEGTFESITIDAEPVDGQYRRGTSVDLIFL